MLVIGWGPGSDFILVSDEMFMGWLEESGVEGSLFMTLSMKVSMSFSSIWLGWEGRYGGVGMSSRKAHILGILSMNEEGVEKIESEEKYFGWFGLGSFGFGSVIGGGGG